MSDQHFDDFIKRKLHDHVSPVPGDMWNRIQATKEKERRGIAWWQRFGPAGLSVVAIGLAGTLYFTNKKETIDNTSTQNTRNRENNELVISQQDNSTNNSEKVPAEQGTVETLQPAAKSFNNDDHLGTNTSGTSKTGANATVAYNSTGSSTKEQKHLHTKEVESAGKKVEASPSLAMNGAERKNTSMVSSNQPSFNNSSTRSKTNSPQFLKKAITTNNTGKDIFERLEVADFLAIHQAGNWQINSGKNQLTKLHRLPITECPSAFNTGKNDWFIEAFASPDYAFKRTQGSAEYLRRKDSTEHFRGAFTAGIRLSKTLGENLVLKTGLQYSQINEKFDYRAENEKKQITIVTVRTIIRAPGDTVRVTDTSTMEQIGYRVKTTYNRYRSFDVPVILGFEWGNDNFRTSLNTGVIFNLQSWQQGDMLDSSFNPIAFDKGSQFKQNIGLGLYASVQFLKRISDRMEAFAEPHFRYNISNMTNNGGPFNQRFHSAGLNLGIRYKLNSNRQR